MTGGNILHQIISAITDLDDRDASELPPLYDSIDPDALQAVVESGAARIEFLHAGYRIVIVHGEVTVYDITGEGDK